MNELNYLKFGRGRLRLCVAVIVLALFCIVLTEVGFAQSMGTIRGTAVDQGTGEPMIGANVVVQGTTFGAATDRDGNYVVNVPPGNYQVKSLRSKTIQALSCKDGLRMLRNMVTRQAISEETEPETGLTS